MAAEHEFTGSRLHGAASGSGSSGEMHLDYMTVTSDSGLFGRFFFFFFWQRKVSVEGSHEARDI